MERSRIRRMMRGYKRLKADNKLDAVHKLYLLFSHLPFLADKKPLDESYLGNFIEAKKYYLNQYFLSRIFESNFNKVLLAYYSDSGSTRFSYPLPLEAINALREEGINIEKCSSLVRWNIHCLYHWLKGIYLFVNVLSSSVIKILTSSLKAKSAVSNIVFLHINKNSLTHSNCHTYYNFLNWYINWKKNNQFNESNNNIEKQITHQISDLPDFIYKNFRVSYRKSVLPDFVSIPPFINYFFYSVLLIAYSFVQLLVGNWRNAYLLGELIKNLQLRFSPDNLIPSEIYFNNSSWICRPLWSYEAEKRGAEVNYYFYSTNIEMLDNTQSIGWDIVTWSKYLVWDNYSLDFIQKNAPFDPEVIIVGPIDFVDSNNIQIEVPDNSFAIFDVQPFRESFYRRLALKYEYYTPSTSRKFMEDISNVLGSRDATFLLKRKRDIGDHIHPHYRAVINKISKDQPFIEISPEINPLNFITKVRGVICMPFTSVALLAVNSGIPAAFYDPVAFVRSEDSHLAHGLPILKNSSELSDWIASLKE